MGGGLLCLGIETFLGSLDSISQKPFLSMKKLLFSLCLLCYSVLCLAQPVSVSNSEPSWGSKIIIYYQPDSTSQFQLGDDVYMRWTSIDQENEQETNLVRMKKMEDRFAVEIEVQEGTSAYSMQFQSGTTYDRRSMLVVKNRDENGRLYRNAHQQELMQSPDLYKTELRAYPDNFTVYQTRWQLLAYTAKDSAELIIRRELAEIEKQGVKNAAYYFAKTVGYTQLGEWELAREFMGQLMSKFPQSALIEKAYSWFQYQSFAQAAPDSLLQQRIKSFIQEHPQNAIAKGQLRLFYEKDSVLNPKALARAAQYWMKEDDSDPLLYYHLARSKKRGEEVNRLLEKATSKLTDPYLMMKHHHTWSMDIPYYLMQIMTVYKENGNPASAWEVIQLIEKNTKKLSADHFQQKGQILSALKKYEAAVEAYLIAADQGGPDAKTAARILFEKELVTQEEDFDTYAEALLRRLFYEEEVVAAAPFEVADIQGNTYSLEELKGKVVVLNFWFIGCAPCRIEIPGLNEMVGHYDQEQVVFIAFALDDKESLSQFLTESPFKYQIIPGAFEQADAFHVQGYPTHIILDKKGNIRSTLTGGSADRHKQIQPLIDRLLRY